MKRENDTKINIEKKYLKSNRNSSILVVSGIMLVAFIIGTVIIINWNILIILLLLPIAYVIFSLIYQPIIQNGRFFNQLIRTINIDIEKVNFSTFHWNILGLPIYKSKSQTILIKNINISQIPLNTLKNKWWHKDLTNELVFDVSLAMSSKKSEKYFLITDILENSDLIKSKILRLIDQDYKQPLTAHDSP